MKLIAIDPGYDRCGVAIVESGPSPTVLFSSCISTDKNKTHSDRLTTIYETLQTIVSDWSPEALALETLFFSVNKKTALKVAEARGMILVFAGIHRIPVIELSPQEVKLSMTGLGNASKEQIQKMISLTLSIETKGKIDDELDAIALGVAALQKLHVENFTKRLANKK